GQRRAGETGAEPRRLLRQARGGRSGGRAIQRPDHDRSGGQGERPRRILPTGLEQFRACRRRRLVAPRNKYLHAVLGENKTTIRVGFRMIYDRIGSALAVAFDQLNSLGFTSSSSIAVNTYNVSDRLGPLFTGYNQDL